MKALKTISLSILFVSLFVSVDLGINCIGSLVPELQDGIAYNSFLQSSFGLLEGTLRTRADFFNAFKTSAWVTFVVLAENATLYIIPSKKQQ